LRDRQAAVSLLTGGLTSTFLVPENLEVRDLHAETVAIGVDLLILH
jgi:hypothetical protein